LYVAYEIFHLFQEQMERMRRNREVAERKKKEREVAERRRRQQEEDQEELFRDQQMDAERAEASLVSRVEAQCRLGQNRQSDDDPANGDGSGSPQRRGPAPEKASEGVTSPPSAGEWQTKGEEGKTMTTAVLDLDQMMQEMNSEDDDDAEQPTAP
jgi:hypothetical protein